MQRYGNFLILPNFTLQSYVKRIWHFGRIRLILPTHNLSCEKTMWCKKFLYAFSSRKQQEARNPSSTTEPIFTSKAWQLWQLWQFSAPTPTSLSLEVTYNIYKYIYNKLNIIITIWKQPEFIYPSAENCHNCHNCHNCNAPSLLLLSFSLHPVL